MEVYQGETDMDARLTQTAALAAINRHIPKDACVIGAAGSLPGCMQRMWRAYTRDTYNMEYGYSCMGYEISGALGVKLAAGDREVYSMVGDGSFIMLHSELLTAVQCLHKAVDYPVSNVSPAAVCGWLEWALR